MSDEHTNSKITRFNSPPRSNQKVSTLINMIQVGQWYGIYQKEGEKSETQPTIQFRNMQDDLNKKRVTPARQSTSSGSEEEASETVRLVDMIDDDDEDDMVVDVDIEDTPDMLKLDPDINLDASSEEGSSRISLGSKCCSSLRSTG
ncbi:hypothetical protein DFS33DRAFT_1416495 [Desarmillaria ectypa]|nr:hypothetical protein DFS33DRAFT_1416495 [Desarmillaria ectypa]